MSTLKLRTARGLVINAVLFLAVGVVGGHGSVAAQDLTDDYIPSSAFLLIDAKPMEALAQPSMDLVPREIIKVFGEKELGINLLEIKRVTFLMDPIEDEKLQQPPGMGVIVQFQTPQKLGDKVLENLEATTFDGKLAYALDEEVTLVVMSEHAMLLGTPPFLNKMVNAKGASSELIERFKKMPDSDHFNVVGIVEPMRALLKKGLPPKEQVPPPFHEFLNLPDMIHSLSYRGNFSPEEVSSLTIEATDERASRRILSLVDYGVDLAKGSALMALGQQMNLGDPDYEKAVTQYADRLSAAIRDGLKPEVNGLQLVYDLKTGNSQPGVASIATIGVLTGMLLPAVQQVREAARRTESLNRMRQLALAIHNYESAHMKFPMQANYDDEGRPLLSWRVHLLPFIEEYALYEQFKLDEPWDSEHNIKLLDKMPVALKSGNFDSQTHTLYLAVSGEGTIFPGNQKIRFGDITDGTSNTAMLVEADPDLAVEWTRPQDWVMNKNNPLEGLGNLRPNGFNCAFADGSCQFIQSNMDPENWSHIVGRNDGNVVDR